MTIASRPTNQDPASQLLWNISKQIEQLKGIASNPSTVDFTPLIAALAADFAALTTTLTNGSQETKIVDALGAILAKFPATIANGDNVALGSTTDAKSAATDATAATLMQIQKEISFLFQSVESAANTARTAATIVVPTQLVDPNGYTPQIRSTGELNVMMNAHSYLPATHWSPRDGVFTYTSSSTLTATGFPFTVDNTCQIRSIGITRANNSMVLYENGTNGISLYAVSNVLTILKDGVAFTTFLNTDLKYAVAINYSFQTIDNTLDATKTIEQSPNRNAFVQDSLVDTTNVAAAIVHYPSALGMSMDGYKDLSLSWKIIEGDAVVDSIEVQFTNDEDTTNADWITGYVYDVKNNAMVNIASTTVAGVATAGTYTGLWDVENCNFSYFRVKTVVADATNTWIIKIRRKA